MIIKEFLPNPIGKDTEGEYIKILNDSATDVNLNGWSIKDASGKSFTFNSQLIKAKQELAINYKTTGINLNNTGETIYLLDNHGQLIDQLSFSGASKEGQVITKNTPGLLEQFPEPPVIINTNSPASFWLINILSATILASIVIYIIKTLNLYGKKNNI